jgi:hypothetical protein
VPGLVACVLVLAGCAGAGVVQGQPDCGHLTAGGKAAVFFVNSAGGTGACGYTYAGKPAGRLLTYPRCVEACVVPWPSPDGHYELTGFTVTDTASGRVVARLPDDVLDYVWASDSRHLCGVLGGPAVPVVLVVAGLGGRPEQVTLAPLFTRVRYSNTGLVVCDPRHARAVLQASYNHVTAVAVVSLSNGAVMAEHDFPDTGNPFPDPGTPMVTGVVASADGRYLAVLHSIQPASGSPGPDSSPTAVTTPSQPAAPAEASPTGPAAPVPAYLDVFDINHPGRPIARLAAAQAVAFSSDGTLLAEQVPRTHGGEVTRVVRWSDGQIIWQSNETLAGEVSSPGVPVIAIATCQPGRPGDQIVLVRPDGQSIPVADGQLAGP